MRVHEQKQSRPQPQALPHINNLRANSPSQADTGSLRATTFEGDTWERDASRRAEDALARQGGAVAAGEMGTASGEALDPAMQAAMEMGFGHDFSRVRVFADETGDAAAVRVGARAITVNHNIFFARGEYRRDVLAHELAHVVQKDLGAPALAYRNGHQDLRRVENALRGAIAMLRHSVRFLPTQMLSALVNSMVSVLSMFFPSGHGQRDEHGNVTRESRRGAGLTATVTINGRAGTYSHPIEIYLSEETPGESSDLRAKYSPHEGRPGGEIRIYVHRVAAMNQPQLISAFAHELVHLFSDFLIRMQPIPPTTGRAEATRNQVLVGGRIDLADPELGFHTPRRDATFQQRLAFGSQLENLQVAYEPVIDFVNQQRASRGAAPLPRGTGAAWAHDTARELLAFLIAQEELGPLLQLEAARLSATAEAGPAARNRPRGRSRRALHAPSHIEGGAPPAVQSEAGPHGLVAVGDPPLNTVRFFRDYAESWLDDQQDRQALSTPEGIRILGQVGRSPQMRAVLHTIKQWVLQIP